MQRKDSNLRLSAHLSWAHFIMWKIYNLVLISCFVPVVLHFSIKCSIDLDATLLPFPEAYLYISVMESPEIPYRDILLLSSPTCYSGEENINQRREMLLRANCLLFRDAISKILTECLQTGAKLGEMHFIRGRVFSLESAATDPNYLSQTGR